MKGTDKRFDAGAFFGGTDSEAYRFLGAHRAQRGGEEGYLFRLCLLYTSPSPRD